MHLCAELIAVSMMLEPLGEVGANFSLQLSSRTQFTKINNKKVIAENQCEKHKKSSLVFLEDFLETDDFEKHQQTTKHMKHYPENKKDKLHAKS